MIEWKSVSERPEWDHQPGRQFIYLEGSLGHSGARWHRAVCGIAFIRKPGTEDEMLGYRKSDILQLCKDGDMDLWSAEVKFWAPATFPPVHAEAEKHDRRYLLIGRFRHGDPERDAMYDTAQWLVDHGYARWLASNFAPGIELTGKSYAHSQPFTEE